MSMTGDPVEGMRLLNILSIETFYHADIEPGAAFTLIEWTPGSQFAVQPDIPWHGWTDALVFQEGDFTDEHGHTRSLLEVLNQHFIPIGGAGGEETAITQAVIDKYRGLRDAGEITGYAIWYADGIRAYFPQWKDTGGVWHLFKNDQQNRFVRSGDLDVIEGFMGPFAHTGIEYH